MPSPLIIDVDKSGNVTGEYRENAKVSGHFAPAEPQGTVIEGYIHPPEETVSIKAEIGKAVLSLARPVVRLAQIVGANPLTASLGVAAFAGGALLANVMLSEKQPVQPAAPATPAAAVSEPVMPKAVPLAPVIEAPAGPVRIPVVNADPRPVRVRPFHKAF